MRTKLHPSHESINLRLKGKLKRTGPQPNALKKLVTKMD